MKKIVVIIVAIILSHQIFCQSLTQTIKGIVTDRHSQQPIPGVTIIIVETNPPRGTVTDVNGNFRIDGVPVGRCQLKISSIGYESLNISEVLVSSGKETTLDIKIQESVNNISEVLITAKSNKDGPLNAMATLSARQLNIEEASRYAGGFDDPARLASSFAGVTASLGNNGIVVRGNAPKDLLWRMEGVEISNPNHFANLVTFGGGGLTALSSNVLASSDFFTGAFPAEYGNALSGVFDIKMRTGNADKHEHTFQIGAVGIDAASEGPLLNKNNTYVFNYRYSTLALLAPVLPIEMGVLKYQDLSFKLNFKTKRAGTFSLWGIGAYDVQRHEALEDTTKWKKEADELTYDATIYFGATGINHKLFLNPKTYVNSVAAISGNGLQWKQQQLDKTLRPNPKNYITNNTYKFTLSSFINHKFSSRHTNRSGLVANSITYKIKIKESPALGAPLAIFSDASGNTELLQVFSQSNVELTQKITLNAGIHAQYLSLNKHYTIEPRAGLRWNYKPLHAIGLAYGLHSRMEMLNFYMLQQNLPDGNAMPNKQMDFSKAHHLVLGYDWQLSEYLRLKIEPYYQLLFNIPVVPGSYYSLQNLDLAWYFNDSLVNKGKGKNIGIDLTFERFLNKGYYYLFTTSIFDSKYTGGNNKENNTRYNRNFVVNVLTGKEWKVGSNNLMNAGLKITVMGGDRYTPYLEDATHAQQAMVYDYNKAFSGQFSPLKMISFNVKYRINKQKFSSIWSLDMMNALAEKEFRGYKYDVKNKKIEKEMDLLFIPNISYKIEF